MTLISNENSDANSSGSSETIRPVESERRKFLSNQTGKVVSVLSHNRAGIEFQFNGSLERVFLKKNFFYYNGKRLASEETDFKSYIDAEETVNFWCKPIITSIQAEYQWMAVLCWVNKNLADATAIRPGLKTRLAVVENVKSDYTTLRVHDNVTGNAKAYFESGNYYVDGKRPSNGSKLGIGDKVIIDAVPCLPQENQDNCDWYATCVFVGKRPETNKKVSDADKNNGEEAEKEEAAADGVHPVLQIIDQCRNEPATMFLMTRGIISQILSEECGIILVEVEKNQIEKVFFHRKGVSLAQKSLENDDLLEIFKEGDPVKTVAVAAPENFGTEWVAVSVGVYFDGSDIK